MKTVIFFEDIGSWHCPFVLYHLWRGNEIRVFDFNCNLKKKRWLRLLINSDRLKRFYIHPYNKEHGDAIEQTERIFEHLKHRSPVRLMSSLYKSDETTSIFKKILVREIFKVLYMNRILSEAAERQGDGTRLYFVPDQYGYYRDLVQRYGSTSLDPLPGIGSLRGTGLLPPIIHALEKIKCLLTSLLVILSFTLSIVRVKLLGGHRQTGRFHAVVALNYALGIKFREARDLEFLLGGTKLHPLSALFLLTPPFLDRVLERSLTNSSYQFLRCTDVDHKASFPFQVIGSFFRMLWSWDSPAAFLRAFFVGIRVLLRWNLLLRHLSFSHYLYTNEEGPDQIALNILLRKEGRSSWCYPTFLGGPFVHSSQSDFRGYENIHWSFLNPDHFLVTNQDVANYYKLHRQTARSYVLIGSPFSEMICQRQKNFNRSDTISRLFGHQVKNGTKIVSFYDTTFIDADNCPSTFEDGLAFYEDILKLLNSSEDLLAIIKPAKDDSWFIAPAWQWSSPRHGNQIIQLWKTLQAHPRVFWAGDRADSAMVITASDLVITHCMSSPTAEALGARKKAIWYESGDKHRGNNLYDHIPGLVSHGYLTLQENVHRLLYSVTDEEYSEYLERYIKGTVDPYLDGQAFTRFRNLIHSTNPA